MTPQFQYENSTALGYDAEPDASNQVMLGDTNVTEIKSTGSLAMPSATFDSLTIDNSSGTDAVITMDGTSNDPGTFTYESDNTLFILNKNVVIGDGAAGVDYTLSFKGEDSDGTLTWMEDEAKLALGASDFSVDTDTLVVDSVANTVNGAVFFGDTDNNFSFGNADTLSALQAGAAGNIAIGRQAGILVSTGDDNVIIGKQAGIKATTGSGNFFMGKEAGAFSVASNNNVAIGNSSLRNFRGATAAGENVAVGYLAMSGQANADAFNNTSIGASSGRAINDGKQNVFIGRNSGRFLTDGDDNVFIGHRSGYNQTTNSNLLIIDNQDRGSVANEILYPLLYGVMNVVGVDDPTLQSLRINGEILGSDGAKIGDGGTTNYLQIEADGDTQWVGAGTGVPYGSMFNHDTSSTVVIAATATAVRVPSGFIVGQTNNMTFQNSREIVADIAGVYRITWQISFTTVSANQEIEGFVMIDNVLNTQASAHRRIGTGTDTGSMSGTCILDLPAASVISLGVLNETSTSNVIIEHSNMSVNMLGGT